MNISAVRSVIAKHPLIKTLVELKGNPKVCILIEPLWGIPYNLIGPFATLYMFALGVKDFQIGILLSIAMVVQVFFAFSAGVITDKLGRKTTTILGDFFGWVVPCIIWAISQNFWFFLGAMLMNSFEQVNQTAWTCLLVEDAPSKSILHVFKWVIIAGLLTVFFAPISGSLIQQYSVVPVMRGLYFLFAFTMAIKCIITLLFTKETKQGKVRKRETKGQGVLHMLKEYKQLFPRIVRTRATMKTFSIMVVLYITTMINSNFFALYVNKNLQISEAFIALFPILRAAVMLVFMFGVQHWLDRFAFKVPMGVGFGLYILCQAILLFSPPASLGFIFLFTFLEAVAFALVIPGKDSMMVHYVDPKERARIVSMLTALMILVAAPFGSIIGFLSEQNRRFPFILSIVLYVAALLVIVRFREKPLDEEAGLSVDIPFNVEEGTGIENPH